jgi:hypothetical protein
MSMGEPFTLPKVWFIVDRTQAKGRYELHIGLGQDASFAIYGTLDELDQHADHIKRGITEARRHEVEDAEEQRRFRECGACQDGWANSEDHTCPIGDNGGWGPEKTT